MVARTVSSVGYSNIYLDKEKGTGKFSDIVWISESMIDDFNSSASD